MLRFGEIFRPHFQGCPESVSCAEKKVTILVEAASCSKTSVPVYHSKRHCMPEIGSHNPCCTNLKRIHVYYESCFILILLPLLLCSSWFLVCVGLAGLADGPILFGEVARDECLFVWNFSATRSAVLKDAERRTRPNTMLH